MNDFFLTLWFLLQAILLGIHQVSGQSIMVSEGRLLSINGSTTRFQPLLTDGVVPTLANFETGQWADQLVTLLRDAPRTTAAISIEGRGESIDLELTMFNCPEWGIGADRIRVSRGEDRDEISSTIIIEELPTSCDGLVHVCVDARGAAFMELSFELDEQRGLSWVHIGELVFSRRCPSELLVPASALESQPNALTSSPPAAVNGSVTSDLGLVLDGIVVTLSEFERSHWASQLITIPFRHDQSVDVRFTAVSGLLFAGTVEVVMFNCPDWSIGARVITITGGVNEEIRTFGSVSGFPTSCNRLVHVCIPVFTNYESLIVSFEPFNDQPATNTMSWVHLAEVIFTGENCPTDLIVPGSSVKDDTYTLPALIFSSVGCGVLACFLTTIACLILLKVLSRRRAKSYRSFPSSEGKAKVTGNASSEAPVNGDASRKTSAAQLQPSVAQSLGAEVIRMGKENQTTPSLPSKRPPEPVPRPNTQPSPLPGESRTSLASGRGAGSMSSLVGGGDPPHPTNTYMKVLDAREEEEREMELYEDLDEAGSYLTPDQVNCVTKTRGEREGDEGVELYEDMDEAGSYLTPDQVNSDTRVKKTKGEREGDEGVELYEDMDEAGSYLTPDQVNSNTRVKKTREGDEEVELYEDMDEAGSYLTPDQVNSNAHVKKMGEQREGQ